MPHLLLFDIDGTLILTGGAGGRAMTRAFRDVFGVDDAFRGVPMPGRTDPLIVADAVAAAGLDASEVLVPAFRERYREVLAEEIQKPGPRKGVLPGVRLLLAALAPRHDVVLALLTGNYSDAARVKLEYFDLWRYFTCGAYGEEAADRNGLVAVAVERAAACGVHSHSIGRIVVVGDTPLDVACAHAGGAVAIAVATGFHSKEELKASGADVVLEDLSDTDRFLRLVDEGFRSGQVASSE